VQEVVNIVLRCNLDARIRELAATEPAKVDAAVRLEVNTQMGRANAEMRELRERLAALDQKTSRRINVLKGGIEVSTI